MSSLRQARDHMGLSREKVAMQIGVSSRTIERWEKGQSGPRRWQLIRLARIYGVTVDELDNDKAAA